MAQNLTVDYMREVYRRLAKFEEKDWAIRVEIRLRYYHILYAIQEDKNWREAIKGQIDINTMPQSQIDLLDEYQALAVAYTPKLREARLKLYQYFILTHDTTQFIHEDNLVDYVKTLANNYPSVMPWVSDCINWPKAAREHKKTMKSVEWEGATHYY